MSGFDKSRWADDEFSEGYAENADDIIQERRKLVGVLGSCYGFFFGAMPRVRVMDLGSGDGTLTRELMDAYGNILPTLIDGSPDMLARARRMLSDKPAVRYVEASFDMLTGPGLEEFAGPGGYEFIFSSLAIHHLEAGDKALLYRWAYDRLEDGGRFVNIDVTLPPSGAVEAWYFERWRDWVRERSDRRTALGLADIPEVYKDVPSMYKDNEDNLPELLETQMDMLETAGFAEVDCYYKNGIFAVFGGLK